MKRVGAGLTVMYAWFMMKIHRGYAGGKYALSMKYIMATVIMAGFTLVRAITAHMRAVNT